MPAVLAAVRAEDEAGSLRTDERLLRIVSVTLQISLSKSEREPCQCYLMLGYIYGKQVCQGRQGLSAVMSV